MHFVFSDSKESEGHLSLGVHSSNPTRERESSKCPQAAFSPEHALSRKKVLRPERPVHPHSHTRTLKFLNQRRVERTSRVCDEGVRAARERVAPPLRDLREREIYITVRPRKTSENYGTLSSDLLRKSIASCSNALFARVVSSGNTTTRRIHRKLSPREPRVHTPIVLTHTLKSWKGSRIHKSLRAL